MSADIAAVGGRRLDCAIATFEHRCQRLIYEEQRKPLPDTALIAVLCDAVRCAREYVDVVESYNHARTEPPAHTDHPLRHYDRTCPACNVKEK